MVCVNGTCGGVVVDNPSILGRAIIGRSVPGMDVRYQNPNGQYYEEILQTNPQPQKLSFDWGSFAAGIIIGGIVVGLLVTATGRGIMSAAGQRTAGYIRGK